MYENRYSKWIDRIRMNHTLRNYEQKHDQTILQWLPQYEKNIARMRRLTSTAAQVAKSKQTTAAVRQQHQFETYKIPQLSRINHKFAPRRWRKMYLIYERMGYKSHFHLSTQSLNYCFYLSECTLSLISFFFVHFRMFCALCTAYGSVISVSRAHIATLAGVVSQSV